MSQIRTEVVEAYIGAGQIAAAIAFEETQRSRGTGGMANCRGELFHRVS